MVSVVVITIALVVSRVAAACVTSPAPFAEVVNAEVTVTLVVTRLVSSKTVVKKLVVVCVVTRVETRRDTVVFAKKVDPLEGRGADTLGVLVRVGPILIWETELAGFDKMLAVASGMVVCVEPGRFADILGVREFCVLMELVGINIESIWRGTDSRIILCEVVSTIA